MEEEESSVLKVLVYPKNVIYIGDHNCCNLGEKIIPNDTRVLKNVQLENKIW